MQSPGDRVGADVGVAAGDGDGDVAVTTAKPRSRRSAKAAGTRFESLVAGYLAAHLDDDRIERRAKTGGKDRGDITGLRHMGQRIVVEAKDRAAWSPGTWLGEADVERRNDDAGVGIVVAKRHGIGAPGQQVVMMTLADFASLLAGHRPDEE